jgi:hypothetical protein
MKGFVFSSEFRKIYFDNIHSGKKVLLIRVHLTDDARDKEEGQDRKSVNARLHEIDVLVPGWRRSRYIGRLTKSIDKEQGK